MLTKLHEAGNPRSRPAGFDRRIHFYESQQAGLGAYFLSNLYSKIESLRIYGGIHQKAYKQFHRALADRFPFAIYYTVSANAVYVQAVVDCRRKPSWIRHHLRDASDF